VTPDDGAGVPVRIGLADAIAPQGRMTAGPGAVRNSLIRRNAFIERVAALSEAGSTPVWSSAWTA
jgi:hypothetical protein